MPICITRSPTAKPNERFNSLLTNLTIISFDIILSCKSRFEILYFWATSLIINNKSSILNLADFSTRALSIARISFCAFFIIVFAFTLRIGRLQILLIFLIIDTYSAFFTNIFALIFFFKYIKSISSISSWMLKQFGAFCDDCIACIACVDCDASGISRISHFIYSNPKARFNR